MTKNLQVPTTPRVPVELLLRRSMPAQPWQLTNPTPMLRVTDMTPYRPTRREFLIGTGSLLVLAPYGCGGESGAGGETTSGGGRTVVDEYGESRVPDRPGRVLSLYDTADLDAGISLGVDLLAYGSDPQTGRAEELPWKQSGLEETGAELIPIAGGPNFEQIASLKPELILSSYADEEVMDRLRELCPVVYVTIDDWREGLRTAGRALYRDEEAKAVISETEQKISRIAEKLSGRIPESVDVLHTYDETNANVDLWNRKSAFGKLLEEVGFPPLREGEADFGQDEVSREVLPEKLTSEALILMDFGYEGEELSSAADELLNDPLIADTPAIKAGNVLRMTPVETAASYLISALSIPTVLEGLERFPA